MDDGCGSDFRAEVNSTFEPWLIEKVCEPTLQRIPESVHPNTISALNHLVAWMIGGFSYLAIRLEPLGRTLAMFGAGVCVFCLAIGDCLDGMQARRTDRCSKLGEMLDHWLDAVHVPLVTFGVSLVLMLNPWKTVLVHVTNAMIYNAQLVLYHKTGKFVHPGTSGTDAQVGVSIGYLVTGIFYYFFDPSLHWVQIVITVAVILAILMQLKLNLFYYVRLRGLVVHHLPFVLLCGGFSALHLLGIIGQTTFLLSIVFLSFRITGSYVLFTILKRRYWGFDVVIALLVGSMLAARYLLEPIPFAARTVQFYLPYAACLYMLLRNLVDFVRHYSELRPAPSSA